MESTAPLSHAAARALLEWHLEAGVDEAIGDEPVDRYSLEASITKSAAPAAAPAAFPAPAAALTPEDAIAAAQSMAAAADTLEELAAALQNFPHCDLHKGARNLVFADGLAGARVMIIGEAPSREDDVDGRPLVGPAGQLLDRMLAAIDLSRQAHDPASAVYITNVLPWRPPANRPPDMDEIAMMRPFLQRHIALAAPDFLLLLGNAPCQALLGAGGMTRLRGKWADALGRPALPIIHPADLLRAPLSKRETWADLLQLRSRLNETARPKTRPAESTS